MRVSAPGRSDPGRAPAHTVVIFIIRRLIGTIFPLVAVSMIRFAIFFLIPRLAGQNTYQLAAQQVGRNPTRQAILQVEQQLGPGPVDGPVSVAADKPLNR